MSNRRCRAGSRASRRFRGLLIDVEKGIGIGFGLGYYLSDRLIVGGDFEWLSPDCSAELVDDNGTIFSFDHDLTQLDFRFKAFNFLTGPDLECGSAGAGLELLTIGRKYRRWLVGSCAESRVADSSGVAGDFVAVWMDGNAAPP